MLVAWSHSGPRASVSIFLSVLNIGIFVLALMALRFWSSESSDVIFKPRYLHIENRGEGVGKVCSLLLSKAIC